MQDKNIATPNAAHAELAEVWQMVDAVMGGTRTMRAAAKRYLYKWDAESDSDYDCRLKIATFLPAYRETVAAMVGRVFAKPIAAKDVGPKVTPLLENIDRNGNDLNEYAARWFAAAISYGVSYTLVDMARVPGAQTRADVLAAGATGYLTHVKPKDIIGWRFEGQRLVQLRLLETYEEADGDYHVKVCPQVRLLTPGYWAVWRKVGDTWVMHQEGQSATKEIALVPLYTNMSAPMVALPPLLDLLHQSIKHWNDQSDQDNSVRFCRVRMGFLIGVADDYALKLSVDSFTRLPMGADAKIVQGSAESVKIGREELDALVQQMRESGARLMRRDESASKTASQSNEEAQQEHSALGRMAAALEDAIDQCLIYMAEIEGEQAGSVTVNSDFAIDPAPDQTADVLTRMSAVGVLSKQTVYEETQRRGIVSGSRTWDEELERIDSQPPELGMVGVTDNANG